MIQPLYLSKQEVAKYLGFKSVKTVERHYPEWITKYGLRVSRINDKLRFNRLSVEAMMEQLRVDQVPA